MKQPTGQGAPPYSEEQITRWLAFLARGMTEHDQTIFLIEKLQPSWLSTRLQRWAYLLASRLVWGILSGVVGGFSGLAGGISAGLGPGLTAGLIASLTDENRISNKEIQLSLHFAH